MTPQAKRIKVERFCMFELFPEAVTEKILSFVPYSDVKNVLLVSKQFNAIISKAMKNKTYLYLHNLGPDDDIKDILNTKRDFNEIVFYGKQEHEHVSTILQKFGAKIRIASFAKNDLKFMKVDIIHFSKWITLIPEVVELNLINLSIEISKKDIMARVLLRTLKKLKCYDTFIASFVAPSLEKLDLCVLDRISTNKLKNINEFMKQHFNINHFILRVYCGEDEDIQSVALNIDHLALNILELREFRYSPRDVAKILSSQKDLVKLHLEDGMITSADHEFISQLHQVYDEILNLKKLNKLTIEMPTVEFLMKLQNMPNLKRLHINNIPATIFPLMKKLSINSLEKLCIEGIETTALKKKAFEAGDYQFFAGMMKNLHTLKIDTTPLNVLKTFLCELKSLKALKIIRSNEIARKIKSMTGESNVQLPQTNLEKIICDVEDFKLRVIPIIRASPHLRHVKIYWENKNTPCMSIAFDIISARPSIRIIEFVHNATFVKQDMILFDSNFHFSYNNLQFEIIVLKKEAKIFCRRI